MYRTIIAAAVQDREAFNLIDSLVEEKDFSDKAWIIYKQIRRFYEADSDATQVDKEIICSAFQREYETHADEFVDFINELQPVSISNLKRELLAFKEQAAGIRLANSLLTKDKKAEQVLQEYLDVRNMGEEDVATEMVAPSVSEIFSGSDGNDLIPLTPRTLNDRVGGGIPRGTSILVFAPPESGKTLFTVSLGSGFIESGLKVVYVGNEESHRLVLMRFLNRLTGMTKEEVLEDPELAELNAHNAGYDNLVFAPLCPGSLSDIRRLIDKHKPDVVFVDQLPNLHAPSMSKVEKMDYLTAGMRNLCKQYDIVGISVAQGAESAMDKLVLDLGDVYFSNVAAQGNVDLMFGIGKNAEYDMTNRRMISVCKNKITGDHSPFVVNINPYLSTME